MTLRPGSDTGMGSPRRRGGGKTTRNVHMKTRAFSAADSRPLCVMGILGLIFTVKVSKQNSSDGCVLFVDVSFRNERTLEAPIFWGNGNVKLKVETYNELEVIYFKYLVCHHDASRKQIK